MAGLVFACLPKNCCLCDCVADFGIPCLEDRREQTLKATMFLSVVGLAFAVLGAMGGVDAAGLGQTLAWANYKTVAYYAGVKYICDANAKNCTLFKSGNCEKLHLGKDACEGCWTVADQAYMPSIICAVTYVLYAHNTWKRFSGHDSNQAKLVCMFSCFFAGWNFLGVLMSYYESCIEKAQYKATIGMGLLLMGLGGAGLKFLCGFLHLSLPVEEGSSEGAEFHSEELSDYSDADRDQRMLDGRDDGNGGWGRDPRDVRS